MSISTAISNLKILEKTILLNMGELFSFFTKESFILELNSHKVCKNSVYFKSLSTFLGCIVPQLV